MNPSETIRAFLTKGRYNVRSRGVNASVGEKVEEEVEEEVEEVIVLTIALMSRMLEIASNQW